MKIFSRIPATALPPHIVLMASIIVAVVMYQWPMAYSFDAVTETLRPLKEGWWRLALVGTSCVLVSVPLYRRKPFCAEAIGMVGVMSFLYPSLALVAGLPKDIGLSGVLVAMSAVGLVIFIAAWSSSVSLAWLCKKVHGEGCNAVK